MSIIEKDIKDSILALGEIALSKYRDSLWAEDKNEFNYESFIWDDPYPWDEPNDENEWEEFL